MREGRGEMFTWFDFGRYTYRIRILKPEAEVDAEETSAPGYNAIALWKDFLEVGSHVRAPQRPPTAEDLGIANRLLRRYKRDELLEFARLFWSRYSSPVFEKQEGHMMRLFAARIPDIEAEI